MAMADLQCPTQDLYQKARSDLESGNTQDAVTALDAAASMASEDAHLHFCLGKLYWEAGVKEKALSQFIESARLEPTRVEVFVCLGDYYREACKDTRRAARCYQKAFALDSDNEIAGERLCDMLDSEGQEALETSICQEAAQKSPRALWAWRRLGFMQTVRKEWQDAVKSIQHALRGYPSDAKLWEALALAYQRLGMFTAALKAYGRVLDLEKKDTIFALLQSGIILLSLSSFCQATSMFREALAKSPGYVVAQYGLASSLLGHARECFTQGAFAWSSSLLKEASDVGSKIIALHGNMAAVWKLLGDIKVAYAQALPFTGGETCLDNLRIAIKDWHEERVSAGRHAIRAYQHALHLLPNQASLHTDLGIATHLSFLISGKASSVYSNRSVAEVLVYGGLRLDGTNPDVWATLGIVAQHKGLQQHALIQALRLDSNHALSWACLGQLYLKNGQIDLAKHLYDRARTANPHSPLPWIGMSVIQSSNGSKHDMQEAFASCLYAVQLCPLPEWQLGLAYLGAQINQLKSSQVYAALGQGITRSPLNYEMHNLKGLFSESRKDLQSAVASFQLALIALSIRAGSEAGEHAFRETSIKINLARVLCKAGYAKDALLIYNEPAVSGVVKGDPDALRGYAVVLWECSQRSLALSSAQLSAKAAIGNVGKYAAAAALICKMLYSTSGAVPALDAIQKTPNIVFTDNPFCLTVLLVAIISADERLLVNVLSRIQPFFKDESLIQVHILLAKAHQILKQKGSQVDTYQGMGNLKKALHKYPHSYELRGQLGHMLLEDSHGCKADLAIRCCSIDTGNSPEKTAEKYLSRTIADCLIARGFCETVLLPTREPLCHSDVFAISKMQRWVHMEPSNLTANYYLVLTLFQRARKQKYPWKCCQVILRMVDVLLKRFQSIEGNTSYIKCILEVCASECALHLNDTDLALKFANLAFVSGGSPLTAKLQMGRIYSMHHKHSLLHDCLEFWHHYVGQSEHPVSHYLLAELEVSTTSAHNIASIFQKFIQSRDLYVQEVWRASFQVMMAQDLFQKGDPLLAEKAVAEASQICPNNALIHLLHGAICIDLVKSRHAVEFLSPAISHLSRSLQLERSLPIASFLLAQAEASKDKSGPAKWASNIRKEWTNWPPALRPAELYFQMCIVARQSIGGDDQADYNQSARYLLQRALHLNPGCYRYWTMMRQYQKQNS